MLAALLAAVLGTAPAHPVIRPVLFKGRNLGAAGRTVGFEATTTLNRIDFGITGNQAVEGGGVTLWDDVEVSISIEARTQQ